MVELNLISVGGDTVIEFLLVLVLVPLLTGGIIELVAPSLYAPPNLFAVWAEGTIFILMYSIVWVPAAIILGWIVMGVQSLTGNHDG